MDIDLERSSLTVHNGKGRKDRVTLLSFKLKTVLEERIEKRVELQRMDNARGVGP
ncbi:MAG: recombinase XerD, partial [Gammaproteobacteria bacterium]|nr:recombinase XerD [Gammaproteobacteria bacterium]